LKEQFPDIILPATTLTYGKEGTYIWDGKYFYKEKKELFTDEDMLLIGNHNRENACAVVSMCDLLQIEYTYLQKTLHTF
jgi:UDP-N-acetylmuramoylalanine-D-glutamate ligase